MSDIVSNSSTRALKINANLTKLTSLKLQPQPQESYANGHSSGDSSPFLTALV